MNGLVGLLAAAGGLSAFVVEYLCSRPGSLARGAGITLGTVVSFAAAIILARLFGNHLAPQIPGVLPIVVCVGVALAPLVAVIRGRNRRA
jgi:hypothetical protein